MQNRLQMTKLDFTRTQNVGTLSISAWTKISSLEFTIFELQNDGKKWSRIYFENDRAPSELLLLGAKISAQNGQIGLAAQQVSLKGLGQFQNKFQTYYYIFTYEKSYNWCVLHGLQQKGYEPVTSQRSNTKNFQLWLIASGFGCTAIRPFEKPACQKVSTTPLRQWNFRQCLPFSWTTLKSKHFRHTISIMGVVDMFQPCFLLFLFFSKKPLKKPLYCRAVGRSENPGVPVVIRWP